MDMGDDASDFSMTAFISFPQVLGHEVVADVVEVGPAARGLEVGQRVVLQCWLSCEPRGISPLCPACATGDFSLCWGFTDGALAPGIHVGNSSDATGGFAELLPGAPLDGDTRARRRHRRGRGARRPVRGVVALDHAQPASCGRAGVVWGAGALGTRALAILRALYPDVEVVAVVRHPAQQELARQLGATVIDSALDDEALVVALAEWSGGRLHAPWAGLPLTHPGHIDVCYDTIASPKTIELGAARASPTRHDRAERGPCRRPLRVVALVLQGGQGHRIERLRRRRGRGRPQARHRALPRSHAFGSRRRAADAHAHVPPRPVARRVRDARPSSTTRAPSRSRSTSARGEMHVSERPRPGYPGPQGANQWR